MELIDLTGQRFGYLTVVKLVGHLPVRWLVRCDCGSERVLRASMVKKGFACGCRVIAENKKRATHGMTSTPEYHAWSAMRSRCRDVNHPAYENYGGRGIAVCPEWESFPAFLAAVGPRPSPGHSIDRIKNENGYEPGNVRWATLSQQNSNKRMTEKKHAANVAAARSKGIRKYGVCVSEEARKAGISHGVVLRRLRSGWTLSRALATPAAKVGHRPVRIG